MPKSIYAVLRSADGQPEATTVWPVEYQEAFDAGGAAFEQWLSEQIEPMATFLDRCVQRLPGRAIEAFELAFWHRLEQRLRSQNPLTCVTAKQHSEALALGNRATAMLRLSLEDTLQLANKGELRACTEDAGLHLKKVAALASAISLPEASFFLAEGGAHD
ncbi:hypothetical protein D3C81_708380 [compost metagenome]